MSDHRKSGTAWTRLSRIGIVVIAVAVVVGALVWRQDRPLLRAAALLEQGNAAAALRALDAFLPGRPAHQRGLLLRARTLVALKRWQEAAEILERTGAGTPDELRAWSTALLHQRRWGEALPILEQLTAKHSHHAETLRDLTICRFQLGQSDAALASAAELASLAGHEAEGLFQRGVIHRSMGNTHLSIESWEQIEALTSGATDLAIPPAEFFRVYAEDLMLEARPRLAAAYFQRSLALEPSVAVQARLGEAYYRAGKEAEAARVWNEVLEADDSNRAARMGLAELALSEPDAEKALQWLIPIASPQQPLTPDLAYLMQRAYTLLGDEELANDWRQKAATLRKSNKLREAFEARSRAEAG